MEGAEAIPPDCAATEGELILDCPNCRGAMQALELDGHLGRKVSIDVCHPCQDIWFDKFESLQLEPQAVLHLFKLIAGAGGVKTPPDSSATCPRCRRSLKVVKDFQRTTRFEYRTCQDRHGRLTSFYNFLREKNFIKPLSPAQVTTLQRNVESINCSNCGAPVDLAKGTSCAHCASPLSMLDLEQAEALMESLRSAGKTPRKVDESVALDLERARRDVDTTFNAFERDPGWYGRASTEGLVGAAMGAFVAWLKD